MNAERRVLMREALVKLHECEWLTTYSMSGEEADELNQKLSQVLETMDKLFPNISCSALHDFEYRDPELMECLHLALEKDD